MRRQARRQVAVVVTAAVALALFAGCRSDAREARDGGPQEGAFATRLVGARDEPVQETVELLDAGREPRRALRYRASVGARRQTRVEAGQEQRMSVKGKPAMKADRRTELAVETEVTSAGDDAIECRLLFGASSVAGVEGTVGRVRFDAHGRTLQQDVSVPVGVEAKHLPEVHHALSRPLLLPVILPAEAIGEGARWRFRSLGRTEAIAAALVVDVEAVAIRGDRLELALDVAIEAMPQPAEITPSSIVEVRDITTRGRMRAVLDLDLPLARELTGQLDLDGGLRDHVLGDLEVSIAERNHVRVWTE